MSDVQVHHGDCLEYILALEEKLAQVTADRDKYLTAFSEQFDQREEYTAECKRLWPIETERDALVEAVRALADDIKADFDAYRIDQPTHLRLRAVLPPTGEPT
jgi:hypothetical protein